MTVQLTTAQREAAIAEVRAAAGFWMPKTGAAKIVDRLCRDDSPFGRILRGLYTPRGFGTGYGGGYQ